MNFLDTGPLKNTLTQKLKIREDILENSDKTHLITATNVATGERVVFSNRSVFSRKTGKERLDIVHGIRLNRVMASCSISIVYPWIYDSQTDAYYWDGAVVANTPLGVALDTVQDIPIDIPMEVVVVLMTPWRQSSNIDSLTNRGLPGSFEEALTWTLDWALLSSFRERLRLIEAYNRLAEQERSEGKTLLSYRKVNVIIVSPMEFFSASRIIDYDQASAELIRLGYEAAKEAFESIV